MGRSFYMGGAWARNEQMLRQRENRYADYDPNGPRKEVLGLDSRDFHYKGEAVNILREEPIEDGQGVRVYFERVSESEDRCAGTYAIEARKLSDGRMIFGGGARRVRSY